MRRIKGTALWLLLAAAVESLVPFQFAQAKGHFFSSPIFSIILTVALVALTIVTYGSTSPLLMAAQGVDTVTGALGATTFVAAEGGAGAFVSGIGAESFVAGALATEIGATGITLGSALLGVGAVESAVSLGLAANCLNGGNTSPIYSGCNSGGGNNNTSASTNNAQAEQAAIQANTVTRQSASSSTPTCPFGYNYNADIQQCIAKGYVSCSSAGHSELVCQDNSTCTSDGQCKTTGGSCTSTSGSACTSAANSCGMTNQARYECNGSCPASAPSDSSCAAPGITLSEQPSLTNPGNSCTVNWTVTNATACTLSTDVADPSLPTPVTLPSSSYVSPALKTQATYTLFCHNGIVVTSQLSVICHLNPQFQEQ